MKYKWLSRIGTNVYALVTRSHPIMKCVKGMPGRKLRSYYIQKWFHMAGCMTLGILLVLNYSISKYLLYTYYTALLIDDKDKEMAY